MESNEIIRKQVFQVVTNQLKSNTPPETSLTLKRLMDLGFNDHDAKTLIAQCVVIEIFAALKNGTPFNLERYVANLNKLPEDPVDDENEDS